MPTFDGALPAPVVATAVPAPQPAQPSPTQIPPITPADRANYAQLFARNAPTGLLDGTDSRNIFLKSGLPNETLIQIWNLCDTQNRGQLDQGEFILAMHLIRSIINRTLRQLPSNLPSGALEPMKTGARNTGRTASVSSNNSSRYTQALPPNSPDARASPVVRQYTGPLKHPQLKVQQPEWYITPQDKAKFDSIFSNLDKNKQGVIGAEEVVPFLTTSNLAEETLAQVWDLSDVHNTGQFGKDEFAIAMYLVQQQLMGKTLPTALPASLYPGIKSDILPSSPAGSFAQTQRAQPAAAPAQPPVVANSSLGDLLSLGDSLSTPPPQAPAENITGPASTSSQPIASHLTGTRAPFVPTSTFGQSFSKDNDSILQPAVTSVIPVSQPVSAPPVISAPATLPQTAPQSELFNDPEYANKLSTISTENANLSNQVNSMGAQTEQAKQKRERAEAELSRVLGLKANLESRLTTLRAEYDSEVTKSNQAEQLLHQSQKETDKLSADCSVLEASYHAVQTQYQEISSQLAYDQQENANLKEKIRYLNEETSTLKQTLEKVQKQARQQKGLVSINNKQFSHAESERDKIQAQIDEATSQSQQASGSQSRSVLTPASTFGIPSVAAGATLGAVAGSLGAAVISSPTPSHPHQSTPPSTNPFYGSFPNPQQQIPFSEATPTYNSGFEDRFSHMDIASPSTAEPARSSTHNTVDTPNSSPPDSDYQYNPGNAPIPTFTLPLARPESATSSVQNNPPMSVRGDIDISRPDSPEYPVTSEPVSGIVPPEDLVIRSVDETFGRPSNYSTSQLPIPPDNMQQITDTSMRQSSVATVSLGQPSVGEHITSSTESFEIVPRHVGTPPQEEQISQPPPLGDSTFSPSSESVETAKEATESSSNGNFDATPAVSHSASTVSISGSTNAVAGASIQPAASHNTGSTIEAVTQNEPQQSVGDEAKESGPSSGSSHEIFKDARSDFDSAFESLSSPTASNGANPWPVALPTAGNKPQHEFPPIRELEYEESSSSDEEDDFNKAFSAKTGLTPAVEEQAVTAVPTTTGLDSSHNQPVTTSASVAPISAFPSVGDKPLVPKDNYSERTTFAQTIPVTSAAAFPPPLPSKEADPFDAAFNGLVAAGEETDVSLNFGSSFNPQNPGSASSPFPTAPNAFVPNAAPNVTSSLAAIAPAAPGKSVFDIFPGDNAVADNRTGVPVSNEEWDSIFAGFGSTNNGSAEAPPVYQVDANSNPGSTYHASPAPRQPAAPIQQVARPTSPISQALAELVGMGFEESKALEALKKNNFNVVNASNYLLDH